MSDSYRTKPLVTYSQLIFTLKDLASRQSYAFQQDNHLYTNTDIHAHPKLSLAGSCPSLAVLPLHFDTFAQRILKEYVAIRWSAFHILQFSLTLLEKSCHCLSHLRYWSTLTNIVKPFSTARFGHSHQTDPMPSVIDRDIRAVLRDEA